MKTNSAIFDDFTCMARATHQAKAKAEGGYGGKKTKGKAAREPKPPRSPKEPKKARGPSKAEIEMAEREKAPPVRFAQLYMSPSL